LEKTAHVYIMARSIGIPNVIPDEHIRAMQYFARNEYGQRSSPVPWTPAK
jgi:hypothetical protein